MFTLRSTSRLLSPGHQRHLLQTTSPALRKVRRAVMYRITLYLCGATLLHSCTAAAEAEETGMKDASVMVAGLHRTGLSQAER